MNEQNIGAYNQTGIATGRGIANSPMVAQTARESQLAIALDGLNKELTELENQLDSFLVMLSPVCRQEPAKQECNPTNNAQTCCNVPLANPIFAASSRLNAIRARINYTRDLLDL